jgi:hypothetical protein
MLLDGHERSVLRRKSNHQTGSLRKRELFSALELPFPFLENLLRVQRGRECEGTSLGDWGDRCRICFLLFPTAGFGGRCEQKSRQSSHKATVFRT